MPYWEKLFKAWGIYNIDYHKKYRKYLHSKRYETYINLVANDIQESIRNYNKKQIQELMDRKFPEERICMPGSSKINTIHYQPAILFHLRHLLNRRDSRARRVNLIVIIKSYADPAILL